MATLSKNKKAGFDYQVLEEYEAGIELTGQEVRSVKMGHISLKGAFISIKNGQAYIKNMHISAYQKAGQALKSYNPDRDRRLLLHNQEILNLWSKTNSKGLTIVPISVYTTRRLIKVKIALVKGKKKFDKRADIKKRELKRSIERKMRSF